MKNTIIICFCFLFISALTAQSLPYQADQSQINWTGKAAFSAYSLNGTVQLKSANLQLAENKIQAAQFVFDMKSMNGEIKGLIKHLKSKDFFEVKKYKEASFVLESIAEGINGQKIAKGTLTIKNKTKTIEFPITTQSNDGQFVVKGKAKVNRTDFGITFNSPSYFEKLKEQAIADEFELAFKLVFLR